MYFKYFTIAIVKIYQEPCIKFTSFFAQQIKFYWYLQKKKLGKLKIDNVRKHLKKSQIIFKILSCLENANINIQ